MRALVFGTTGQVARELAATAANYGIEIVALGRDAVDLSTAGGAACAIEATDADIVVNATAYTAVDAAENDADTAFSVNGAAPAEMASAAKAKTIPFLHVSTDYVFDGQPGGAWTETDPTRPLGVYGASKLAGENAVRDAGGVYVILRTAWVFSAHGGNFVKTMLRVGKGRDEMRVVGDQYGGPTAARDIANALWAIAKAFDEGRGTSGTFHFAGGPATSWAKFADEIFERSGWPERPKVTAITTAEWPTKVQRPENSILDCTAIKSAYGIGQPDWRVALNRVISDLNEEGAS